MYMIFFPSCSRFMASDVSRAEGGTRRGNMGHLTRIANAVVQNLEKGHVQSQISDLIKGRFFYTCMI